MPVGPIEQSLRVQQVAVVTAMTQALDAGALLVVSEIKTRTRRGFDIQGRPFPRYSPRYARKKGKTVVNLYDTGEMQGAIDAERIDLETRRIYIRGEAMNRRASYHQEGKRKRREWFGLTEEQEIFVGGRMQDILEAAEVPTKTFKITIG